MLATPNGNKNLNTKISFNECSGLNIEGTEPIKEAFGFGGTIKSNKGDPELIIFIKFNQNVNISGILIESSMDISKSPSNMQLFANKNDLGFSDIGSTNPTESINLGTNLGKLISLRIAKFRSVSMLSVLS
jgi:hypothetical protein